MSDRRKPWVSIPAVEVEAILAVGITLLFGYVVIRVLGPSIPAENRDIAMMILGALIVLTKDTFGRYFSATKGAQEQRRETAAVAATLAATAATVAANSATEAGGTTIKVDPPASVEISEPKL